MAAKARMHGHISLNKSSLGSELLLIETLVTIGRLKLREMMCCRSEEGDRMARRRKSLGGGQENFKINILLTDFSPQALHLLSSSLSNDQPWVTEALTFFSECFPLFTHYLFTLSTSPA
jgi:hypothetical protein